MLKLNKSKALFERAKQLFPGGVNSPVRAFKSVQGPPPFMARGEGAYMFDEDGNEYEEKISVLEYDENGQRLGVKYQHFNRTWNYYYNEFYDKIKTLGVDLMTRITLNEAINQKLTTKEWNTYLSKFIADDNRLVWYRLKSLLGYYAFSENTNKENKLLLGKELDNLKDYEEQTEISFSFDDVKVNLEKHYRKTVQVAYGKLCKKLVPIIENNENATIISIEEIRDVFGKLLKTLE